MHTTAKRKAAVLVLAAFMIAPTVFAVAPAVTETVGEEQAGSRIGTSSGTREST
jgi:hypothetical protein